MRSRSIASRGFSLLEVMVSLAIMGILAMGIGSLLNFMNSSQNNLLSQAGRDDLRSSLLLAFNYPKLCVAAFNNPANLTKFNLVKAQSTGLPLNLTLDGNGVNIGKTIIISGDPGAKPTPVPVSLPSYHVAYEYIAFKGATNIGPDIDKPGNTLFQGSVVMKIDKIRPDGAAMPQGGNMMTEQTVGSLVMSVNPATNLIDNCTSSQNIADACENVGGSSNPNPPPQCLYNNPCQPGELFAGVNTATGLPVCGKAVTGCNAGEGLAPDDQGVLTCQKM